jgi:hypothetical protein
MARFAGSGQPPLPANLTFTRQSDFLRIFYQFFVCLFCQENWKARVDRAFYQAIPW